MSDIIDSADETGDMSQLSKWQLLVLRDCDSPNVMFHSPQLQFRGALVTRLNRINKILKHNIETLHLAVHLLDMFMDAHVLEPDSMSFFVIACYSLATKTIEKSDDVPSLFRLANICGVLASGPLLRRLEWKVGSNVHWSLLKPTAATYAMYLSQFLVTDKDVSDMHSLQAEQLRKNANHILLEYLHLVLTDYRLKTMHNSEMACACLVCVRKELNLTPWPTWLADKLKVTIQGGKTIPNEVGIVVLVRILNRMKAEAKRMQAREPQTGKEDSNRLKRKRSLESDAHTVAKYSLDHRQIDSRMM